MKNNQPFDTVFTVEVLRDVDDVIVIIILVWQSESELDKSRKGDGCSWCGFWKSVGKIQDLDSNDSLRPAEYDAKRILVRRCKLIIENFRFFKESGTIFYFECQSINIIIDICYLFFIIIMVTDFCHIQYIFNIYDISIIMFILWHLN